MATPIGNLRDVTLRALEVLDDVDFVLAEDTRHTRKLLAAHGLATPLLSCHEHNERERANEVVARLGGGERAALVSDAGTPGVSDPGYRLVGAVIAAGLRVVPVPGPSAPIAALVASGLPTDRFAFWGYVPRKEAERRRFWRQIADFDGSSIVFETALRLRGSLALALEVLGPDRPCALARELTKLHEEILRAPLGDLIAALPARPRGELTLCIGPPAGDAAPPLEAAELRRRYRELLASGLDRKAALRRLTRATGMRRREVYEAVVLNADEPTEREPSDGEPR